MTPQEFYSPAQATADRCRAFYDAFWKISYKLKVLDIYIRNENHLSLEKLMIKEIDFEEKEINKFIEIDGSLRDIYINNTDINDWIKLYEKLLKSEYTIFYFTNNKIKELPDSVESIFNDAVNLHFLRVQYENIVFKTHFFCKEQIEFDLDPRDFVAVDQSKVLVDFMHFIADTLNKEVVMTPENCEEQFLIKVLPFGQKIITKE